MAEPYRMIGYIREGPQSLRGTLEQGEGAVRAVASAARKQRIDRVI